MDKQYLILRTQERIKEIEMRIMSSIHDKPRMTIAEHNLEVNKMLLGILMGAVDYRNLH